MTQSHQETTQSPTLTVYTVDEVAKITKLSKRTIMTCLYDGRLKAAKIGRQWRITEKNLAEFLSGDNNG